MPISLTPETARLIEQRMKETGTLNALLVGAAPQFKR